MIITMVLILDIIGILVGLLSIYIIFHLNRKIKGDIGKALNFFIFGIGFMILAFIWTIIFTRLKLIPSPAIDVHHLLMIIGMIFFVISITQFAKLTKP